MRAPDFWYREPSGRDSAPMVRALLTPVAMAYRALTARRIARTEPVRVGAPVVCVGNLTMGGAGKTPVARAVRAALGGAKAGVATLSRGYGGSDRGPRAVTAQDGAGVVGDEPLLHAQDGPAWIAVDRLAGAQAAVAAGAKAIVLDDGFQNPAVAKDLSLLVFDAGAGVGNGKGFPVGPLRESLRDGLARADAAVILGTGRERGEVPEYLRGFSGPVLHAHLAPTAPAPEGRLIAFAGIARPEKFFDTLKSLGADVVDGASYPDHHAFTDRELAWLAGHAEAQGARLITTEKDAVRLPPGWRAQIAVLPVEARFSDPGQLEALLAPIRGRVSPAEG